MKTRCECRSGTNWIVCVQRRISASYGHFRDQYCMNGITKVDKTCNLFMVCVVDQNIPVIGIIMNDLRAQTRKFGLNKGFKASDETIKQCSFVGIVYEMQACTRAACITEIPIQIAERARMNEAL
ncbi:hypothetical protein D3C80_1508690 [compost metagenome]